MINMFLALIIGVMSFTFFNLSNSINAINRLVINTPKEIFEASTYILDEKIGYIYFNQNKLEDKLNAYYQEGLKPYVKQLSINYYYFFDDMETFCVIEKCRNVKIDIEATIFLTYTYQRTMFYKIEGEYRG